MTILLYEKGNITAALADSDKAIRLEPRDVMAYNNRGNAHLVQGKLEETIGDYSQAIQIDPTNASVHFNRGLAMLMKGNEAEAEKDFAQCLRLAGNRKETFEKQIEKIKEAAVKNKTRLNISGMKAGCP